MFRAYAKGTRVVVTKEFDGIPINTAGKVIEMDREDSDVWTYTVLFDNEMTESGIRHYHLVREEE
jgi:hypothetical protein